MPPTTAQSAILRLFQESGPRASDKPITFRTILDALSPGYTKGTVSARLSELVRDGILERGERGTYRLVYAEQEIPESLAKLVAVLNRQLPERTRHGTVVWDATPFLAAREDGVLAPVLVVETARFTGGSTARMLIDHWPGEPVPYVEEFGDRDTLIENVLDRPPMNAPRETRLVLVGPAEGLYASTRLHPEGLRMASLERVLADLLRLPTPAAGDILTARLTSPNAKIDADPLFAATRERDVLPDLFAVLNHLRDRLPDNLRTAYTRRLQGTARAIVGEPDA